MDQITILRLNNQDESHIIGIYVGDRSVDISKEDAIVLNAVVEKCYTKDQITDEDLAKINEITERLCKAIKAATK